jgi:hypothetical protein
VAAAAAERTRTEPERKGAARQAGSEHSDGGIAGILIQSSVCEHAVNVGPAALVPALVVNNVINSVLTKTDSPTIGRPSGVISAASGRGLRLQQVRRP